MRTALGIEYDGTAYNGWQRQKTGVGVQALVEKAVSAVADEPVEVICAGRTDTGVHACAQVVHFDSVADRSDRGWLLGVNSNLPDDVNATWAKSVDMEFHARFSALSRTYRYHILNRFPRSALHRHRAWWIREPVDAERMNEAAQYLVGGHDFSAFRAAGCRASTPVRTVLSVSVTRHGDWITLVITANAFLQHMVRNITGALSAVGLGEQPGQWIQQVLQTGDRKLAGIAAPAQGLTLVGVEYPAEYSIPSQFVYDADL